MKKKVKSKRIKVYDKEGLTLLGQRIRDVRKEKKFTQEEIAYESGLTLSQIARIETSQGNPTVSTIFKIARTLKVNASVLFDFKLGRETNG